LPAKDRQVLLLVALADLTYEEVAQALAIPYGTVCSRPNRARRQARAALGVAPGPACPGNDLNEKESPRGWDECDSRASVRKSAADSRGHRRRAAADHRHRTDNARHRRRPR
jgi:hypothetical protein